MTGVAEREEAAHAQGEDEEEEAAWKGGLPACPSTCLASLMIRGERGGSYRIEKYRIEA